MKKTDEFFREAFKRPTWQELDALEREWEHRMMKEKIYRAMVVLFRLVVVGCIVYFLCTVS